mmetsp:Transcript_34980/g.82926  ORF Transcript_34980/g.82926 Transcript_34980/m.82926 type:complete len:536 (+) Transcript_34980:2-1609(+)
MSKKLVISICDILSVYLRSFLFWTTIYRIIYCRNVSTKKQWLEKISKYKILSFYFFFWVAQKILVVLVFCFRVIRRILDRAIHIFFNDLSKKEEKNTLYQAAKNILSSFFQIENIYKGTINAGKVYFMIIEVMDRDFSTYSIFLFMGFTILKKLHEPWIEEFDIYKKNADEYSQNNRFISILFLSVLIHIETFLSKICLKFYRRRLVNSIVGSELINLSSFLRGFLIDQIFSFINKFLIQNKWISIESCGLHLKLLTSLSGLFSYYIGLKNINITKEGIFRFHLFLQIFGCISEIKKVYLELVRFRKTDIAIKLWMKEPSLNNIENLGDKLCAICRDEMSPDLSRILTCKHIYHTVCLQDWLRLHFKCPLCRTHISFPWSEFFNPEKNSNYQNQSKKKLNILAAVTGFYGNDLNIRQNYQIIPEADYLPSLKPTINDILFNCHRKIPISILNFKEEDNLEKYTRLIETTEKVRSILFDNFVRYSKKTVPKKASSKILSINDNWKKIEKNKIIFKKKKFFEILEGERETSPFRAIY